VACFNCLNHLTIGYQENNFIKYSLAIMIKCLLDKKLQALWSGLVTIILDFRSIRTIQNDKSHVDATCLYQAIL